MRKTLSLSLLMSLVLLLALAASPVFGVSHGGGEGKTSGGRHPVTPWGKPTKGYKTRKRKKASNAWILRRRNRK